MVGFPWWFPSIKARSTPSTSSNLEVKVLLKSPRVIEIFSMSNFLKLLLAIAAVSGQPSNVKTWALGFAFAK